MKDNQIKILTVVFGLGRGGAQRVAQNFALLYQKIGFDSKVITLTSGGFREDILNEAGVQVFDVSKLDEIAKWNPGVVHIHDHAVSDQIIIDLRERLSNAVFMELNTFSLPSTRRHLVDIQTHMTKWCLWKYMSECDIRRVHKGDFNVILPHLNNETKFFKSEGSVREKFIHDLNLPDSAILFGRIGQKNKSKWSEVTLSAFRQVTMHFPEAYLVLVGCPDNLIELINTKYKTIKDKIRILDYFESDEELRDVYSSFDVFVHSAWLGESFGYVLTESMLCETPVVTLSTPYNDNSQVEVVKHNVGGLVAHTEKEFVSHLISLASDSKLRYKLGKGGREHVIRSFSETALSKNIKFLINTLMSQSKDQWTIHLNERFILEVTNDEMIALLNSKPIPSIVHFFLRYRRAIGKLLILRFGWNFLLRNYLKIAYIKNL